MATDKYVYISLHKKTNKFCFKLLNRCNYPSSEFRPRCRPTVDIVSRATFQTRDFLFRKIYIGCTIEMTWPSVRSSVFKCINITNTNFKKLKLTTFDLYCRYNRSLCLNFRSAEEPLPMAEIFQNQLFSTC